MLTFFLAVLLVRVVVETGMEGRREGRRERNPAELLLLKPASNF